MNKIYPYFGRYYGPTIFFSANEESPIVYFISKQSGYVIHHPQMHFGSYIDCWVESSFHIIKNQKEIEKLTKQLLWLKI